MAPRFRCWHRILSAGQFFLRPSSQTAIAVYIAIVGITYSLLLRKMWNPQGAQKIADVGLHDIVPVLYVAFWIFLVPKFTLRWSDAVRWLDFPMLYMVYTLVRGFVFHWYPYYFIDVDTIGWSRSLIHAAAIVARILWAGAAVHRHWSMDRPVLPRARILSIEPQSHLIESV